MYGPGYKLFALVVCGYSSVNVCLKTEIWREKHFKCLVQFSPQRVKCNGRIRGSSVARGNLSVFPPWKWNCPSC